MRKLYTPTKGQIAQFAKNMSIEHNVTLNVIDKSTGKVVQQHEGHNAATNSMITGIAHYLIGDGVFNQGYDMLSHYVPRYISLGTMGLLSQDCDDDGLPIGLGSVDDSIPDTSSSSFSIDQTNNFCRYAGECPGFGADGYDANENNERLYFGLGPKYSDREFDDTIHCELIGDNYPRVEISYRDIVPEYEAEVPKTIDIIYSAFISTGALAQFRPENKDYLFITEAGLWSNRTHLTGGDNGMLAGYRILPSDSDSWNFGTYADENPENPGDESWTPKYVLGWFKDESNTWVYDENLANTQLSNQQLLRKSILRVGVNQVVQVIWKIQIGGLEQLGGISELYPTLNDDLIWNYW